MKLSERIDARFSMYSELCVPREDDELVSEVAVLEAEHAELKREIAEHAEYDWEGNPINWCAALLTAEEQEDGG